MRTTYGRLLVLGLMVAVAGCGAGASTPTTQIDPSPAPTVHDEPSAAPTAQDEPSPTPTIRDITEISNFAPLEPATYFIDPDADSSTPLRVVYTIPAQGWSQWIGAAKFAGAGHVAVSIATVTNVVRHGCRDHSPADPPVGPTAADLATALADLAPFQVTSPPADVTIYGYRGKHLELIVPDLPVDVQGDDTSFPRCADGNLASWGTEDPWDAFYGYSHPGYTEEFWILDVDGSRLMIAAERSPASPAKNVAEQRAILDSIRIEP